VPEKKKVECGDDNDMMMVVMVVVVVVVVVVVACTGGQSSDLAAGHSFVRLQRQPHLTREAVVVKHACAPGY